MIRSRVSRMMTLSMAFICLWNYEQASNGTLAKASRESCKKSDIGATIIPKHLFYDPDDEITVDVRVENRGKEAIYVLKEISGGGTWIDRKRKRMVFAHSAYTTTRQQEAGLAITFSEMYHPEFYRLEAGRDLILVGNFGKGHESGEWQLQGTISFFDEPPQVSEQESNKEDRLGNFDCIVECRPVQIAIRKPKGRNSRR